MRPGGDYDSWYIRGEAGEYLKGFESWDAVEGALLEFYLTGPMHWLGLTDLADDAARLTAYGRAFLDMIPWPTPPETEEKVIVEEDGRLLVSRRVPRIDRFQVARFTTWGAPDDPYTYMLDGPGIAQAEKQGINTGHISAFLSRMLDDAPLPRKVAQLLDTWKGGPTATVSLEQLLVLRTQSPETLNFILETPALRRYLGAQLGSMAVIVRADQWEALRTALGEHSIHAEISIITRHALPCTHSSVSVAGSQTINLLGHIDACTRTHTAPARIDPQTIQAVWYSRLAIESIRGPFLSRPQQLAKPCCATSLRISLQRGDIADYVYIS